MSGLDDLCYPALTHPALTHPALTPPALTHPALTHPALTHPALTHPALTHPALTHPALTHLQIRVRVGSTCPQRGDPALSLDCMGLLCAAELLRSCPRSGEQLALRSCPQSGAAAMLLRGYDLYPIPYTLYPTPDTLCPAPCTLCPHLCYAGAKASMQSLSTSGQELGSYVQHCRVMPYPHCAAPVVTLRLP